MSPAATEGAAALRALHRPGEPVVLPNAWDAAGAKRFEEAGFSAIATTSSAVAASIGRADHELAPADEMLAAVARIVAAVSVPVTADLEAGYGLSPDELVSALVGTGAVGLNLEDTDHSRGELGDPERNAERLAAVKQAASDQGVDVVLNARVDTYLHPGEPEERLEEAVRRARLYAEAGADCVYPILMPDREAVRRFVAEAGAPVNIFAGRGLFRLAELAELGVARVTFGGSLQATALNAAVEQLAEFTAGS
jgi:2-methylisocitrate lyase-like PEP mutase family enzyme